MSDSDEETTSDDGSSNEPVDSGETENPLLEATASMLEAQREGRDRPILTTEEILTTKETTIWETLTITDRRRNGKDPEVLLRHPSEILFENGISTVQLQHKVRLQQ